MPLSQDHKRAFDGDKGPNTGGMGAYTGLPFITEEDREFAFKEIMCKAAEAMVAEGCPLSGVLYGGLMKTPQGIKVIEFNARFGDPETEVVLPLLESDIYDIFEAVAMGRETAEPVWRKGFTLGVVLASKGYPGSYQKGFAIKNMDQVDAHVAHMGTAIKDGQLVTNGGRVLMVIAEGPTIAAAREKVYASPPPAKRSMPRSQRSTVTTCSTGTTSRTAHLNKISPLASLGRDDTVISSAVEKSN